MMNTLIVIESGGKIKTFNKMITSKKDEICALMGINNLSDIECVATGGHILNLNYNDSKGFKIVNNQVFEDWRIIPNKTKEVKYQLLPKLQQAKNIYLCTDNDNEGERISFSVYSLLNPSEKANKNIYRIRMKEINANALIHALKNKEDSINENKVNSSIARADIDLNIGFTLISMMRDKIKDFVLSVMNKENVYDLYHWNTTLNLTQCDLSWYNQHYSAIAYTTDGRVKSYALEEIGKRWWSIQSFKPKRWLSITPIINNLKFNHTNSNLPNATKENGNVIFENLNDDTMILKALNNEFQVQEITEIINVTRNRKRPLILNDIPSDLFLGGAKKMLESAQICYECGDITYPRTEYALMSIEFINANLTKVQAIYDNIPSFKNQTWAEMPPEEFIYDVNKQDNKKAKTSDKDTAHECLRVVSLNTTPSMICFHVLEHQTTKADNMYSKFYQYIKDNENEINNKNSIANILKSNVNDNSLNFKNLVITMTNILSLYKFIRIATLKVLTNAPVYKQAKVIVVNTLSKSEEFTSNLSKKIIYGYSNLDYLTNEDEFDEEKNKLDANELDDFENLYYSFKINEIYGASNYNLRDNSNNAFIKIKQNQAPKLMTFNELKNILFKEKVGTSATISPTILELVNPRHDLVKVDNKNNKESFSLSDLGQIHWNILRNLANEIVSSDWTKNLTIKLKEIEDNLYTKDELVINTINYFNTEPFKKYNWVYSKKDDTLISPYTKTDYACYVCHENLYQTVSSTYCINENCMLIKSLQDEWSVAPLNSNLKKTFKKLPKVYFYTLNELIDKDHELCNIHHMFYVFDKINKDLPSECVVCKKERLNTKTPFEYNCYYCDAKTYSYKDFVYCSNENCSSKNDDYKIAYLPALSNEVCNIHQFLKFKTKDNKTFCKACLLNEIKAKNTNYALDWNCYFCNELMYKNQKNYIHCINEKCPTYNKKYFSGWGFNESETNLYGNCHIHNNVPLQKSKTNTLYCIACINKAKIEQAQAKKVQSQIDQINHMNELN